LKAAVKAMLRDAMAANSNYTPTDKLKVIDRALKLAAIAAKMDDAGYGSGFKDDGDGDDP